MRREVYRYVEIELYDYPATKQEMDELREDILNQSPRPNELGQPIATGQPSDPTLGKATRLLTNRRLKHVCETLEAIERAHRRLPDEKRRLLELKYWRLHQNGQLIDELHVSLPTLYKWTREVIIAVAVELGVYDPLEEAHKKKMRKTRALAGL